MTHPIERPLHHTLCPRCWTPSCVEPERGEGREQSLECCKCGLVAELRHFFDEWEVQPKARREVRRG